ncbi:MAG TPA: beta-ketoacyl-ACP synthase [Arenimonas sp.]|nr:beta-ketoacyl-ACP synthase [Arenimonas sp.]
MTTYLNHLGLITPIGNNAEQVHHAVLNGQRGLTPSSAGLSSIASYVGAIQDELPNIPDTYTQYSSRNNRLLLAAALQLESEIVATIEKYGAHRVAIILGTSTSGISDTESAIKQLHINNKLPAEFNYHIQEMADPARFLADYFKITGPAYVISTACSSSALALMSAKRLLQLNLADTVICGGVDSLCQTTLHGFASLEAISATPCNPFSANRKGINIGEAAVLFIMSHEPSTVALVGCAASSDAHHISAPDPDGKGAIDAMKKALCSANISPDKIDYINLHGTGTQLNDSMESHAIYQVFGNKIPACSSTKALTGHTLGAAGALEAAVCYLLLKNGGNAPQINDGEFDPSLPALNWDHCNEQTQYQVAMSNSFAFGGNNVSLIFARQEHSHAL